MDEKDETAEAEVEGFTNLNSSRSNVADAGGMGLSPSSFAPATGATVPARSEIAIKEQGIK